MSSGTLFPQSFLDVFEAEFQSQAKEMEARFSERISDLIARRRSETEAEMDRLTQEQKKLMQTLQTQRERSLRAVVNAGEKSVESIRLKRLERLLEARLTDFRHSVRYPQYLAGLARQFAPYVRGGTVEFLAERIELDILASAFPDSKLTEKALGRWGGFILRSEGGSLLDCTFRTRWEEYCREFDISGSGRL